MPQLVPLSPGPTWASIRVSKSLSSGPDSSQGDLSDHDALLERSQASSRKRKAVPLSSPSRRPPKSRKLTQQATTEDRVNPAIVVKSTPVSRTATSHGNSSSPLRQSTLVIPSAESNQIRPRQISNSDAATTLSKGLSKVAQRLSLTQPVYSAKTRVKRSKLAKDNTLSSSSSDLPDGIFGGVGQTGARSKNFKPLKLAAERKSRSDLAASYTKSRNSTNAKPVSATASKRVIGNVIEISSDDDPHERVIEISSDEESDNHFVPTKVTTVTAKPKVKSVKSFPRPQPISSRNMASPANANRISTVKTGVSSSSSPLFSPKPVNNSSSLVAPATLSDNTSPTIPELAVHAFQPDDVDMLDADPLDCLTNSLEVICEPTSCQSVTNFISDELPLQNSQVDIRNPTLAIRRSSSLDRDVGNVAYSPAIPVIDTVANTSVVERASPSLAAVHEHVPSDLIPLEADDAMLGQTSVDKDATFVNQSRNLVSVPSSTHSPVIASKAGQSQMTSSPPRHSSTPKVITDLYPMTEGLWGFARRRLQRQIPNPSPPKSEITRVARSSSRKEGLMIPESNHSRESNIVSDVSARKTISKPLDVNLIRSPPKSHTLRLENSSSTQAKDTVNSDIAVSSTTTPNCQSDDCSGQPDTPTLTDVINQARMEYLVRMSSTSPRLPLRHLHQPILGDPEGRNGGSHNIDSPQRLVPTPCSELTLEMSTLHLVPDCEQNIHTQMAPRDIEADAETHLPIDKANIAMERTSKANIPPQSPGDDVEINIVDEHISAPDSSIEATPKAASLAANATERSHINTFPPNLKQAEIHPIPQFHAVSASALASSGRVDTEPADAEETRMHYSTAQVEDIIMSPAELSTMDDTSRPQAITRVAPELQADGISIKIVESFRAETVGTFSHVTLKAQPGAQDEDELIDVRNMAHHSAEVSRRLPLHIPPIETPSHQNIQVALTVMTDSDGLHAPESGDKCPSDADSDGGILVYPDDADLLAATSKVQTIEELSRSSYPEEISSGTSTTSSLQRSRPVSCSRASSSDPIDLLEYINESEFSSGSISGSRNQRKLTSLPVITWPDIRAATRRSKPKHLLAKDLPHGLQDNMNAMDPYFRALPINRTIFEAAISENTMEDEPDAPPIKIINDIDDEPTPPWEFYYTNQMWHGEGVPGPDIENLPSCDCEGSCDPKSRTCVCLKRQQAYTLEFTPDFAYDKRGRLKQNDIPIFECNDLCGCGDECKNRVVQHGRKCIVHIGKTKDKGWGVFVGPKKIPSGTYIGIYSGELLTDAESEMRGFTYNHCGRTYLFDIDHHHLRKAAGDDWETKYVVDAYHAGNFTRFLNHSCDPNCTLNACYINDSNIDKPLLAVFTQRDVEPYEELCFSYSGPPNEEDLDEEEMTGTNRPRDAVDIACRCGAPNCTGIMFK